MFNLDPIWFAVLPIPLVALVIVFLKGRKRIAAVSVITLLPTLVFAAYVLFSLPKIGFPVDVTKAENQWVAFGAIVIPIYNLFWVPPALLGVVIGWLVLSIRKRSQKTGINLFL